MLFHGNSGLRTCLNGTLHLPTLPVLLRSHGYGSICKFSVRRYHGDK